MRNLQRRLERNAQLEREIAKRTQAEDQIRQYADEQAALYTITSAATTSLDPNELLSILLKVVLSVTQADAGWVMLPGPTLDDLPRVVGLARRPPSLRAGGDLCPAARMPHLQTPA